MEKKNAWRGAALLTVVSLLVKILSAMYRVPYQNMVGDIGYYIYQQVYPFFNIGVSIATYGFPVVISKLIAEKIGEGKEEEIPNLLKTAFFYLSILGLILFLSMYFGAGAIATFMGDIRLAQLIEAISFSFLLMPLISLLRGYFQGRSHMLPTAISQLAEQSIRVAVILFMSVLLVQQGYDMYQVGTTAMFGAVIGAAVGLVTLLLFIRKGERVKIFLRAKWSEQGRIARVLFIQGIAICLCNLVIVLLQFVDAFSFVTVLTSTGVEEMAAKTAKGVYDRAFPLIQLGVVSATAVSFALLPSMTAASIRGQKEKVKKYVQAVSKYCFIVALGATVGLISLARPVNIMLFENDAGTNIIQILALAIILTAIIVTTGAVLQSLGKVLVPALFVIVGMVLKGIGNVVFMNFFGAEGAAMATIFALVVVCFGNVVYLYRTTGLLFLSSGKNGRIFIASGVMALVLWAYQYFTVFLAYRGPQSVLAVVGVFIGVVVYVGLLFIFRVITKADGKMLVGE